MIANITKLGLKKMLEFLLISAEIIIQEDGNDEVDCRETFRLKIRENCKKLVFYSKYGE
jgi:hypothetical protein